MLAIDYTGWLYDPAVPDNRGQEFGSTSARGLFRSVWGLACSFPASNRAWPACGWAVFAASLIRPTSDFGVQGTSFIPGNATLLVEVELLGGAEVPFEIVDLREGDGEEAANGRSLSMAYHGWLYDLTAEDNKGDSFDSTTAEAPFTFTLGAGEVIAGWDLGIVGMRVGGRRRIVIPHDKRVRSRRATAANPGLCNAALRGRTARGELIPTGKPREPRERRPRAGYASFPLSPLLAGALAPARSGPLRAAARQPPSLGHRPLQPPLPVLHAGGGVRLAPAEGPPEL